MVIKIVKEFRENEMGIDFEDESIFQGWQQGGYHGQYWRFCEMDNMLYRLADTDYFCVSAVPPSIKDLPAAVDFVEEFAGGVS